MVRHLTTEQLQEWLERDRTPHGDDFLLVNVLSEDDYVRGHIPGSHNVPVKRARLENEVERLAGGKNKPIVVYCSSHECADSTEAARRLMNAGFDQVFDYSGGMSSWIEKGNEVARSAEPTAQA